MINTQIRNRILSRAGVAALAALTAFAVTVSAETVIFEDTFESLDNWSGPSNNEEPIRVMEVTGEDSELFFGEANNPYLRLYKAHSDNASNAITANNVFSEPSEVITISYEFWDNPEVGSGSVTMRVGSPTGVSGTRRTHEVQFDKGMLSGVAGAYMPGERNYLQVIMNNSHADVDYLDGEYTVSSDRFDVWVNGLRVGDDLANRPEVTYDNLPVGDPLGSLQFAIWTVSQAELLVDNLVVYEGAHITEVAEPPPFPLPIIEFTFEGESLQNTGILAGTGEFDDTARVPGFAPGIADGTAMDNRSASGMGSEATGDDGALRYQPGGSLRTSVSLTFTGWFWHEGNFSHDAFLFGKPNAIHLLARGDDLELDLRDTDNNSRWLSSTEPWHQESGRWVFFAFTADLTDGSDFAENAFIYYAYEDSEDLILDTSTTLPAGPVRSVSHEATVANNFFNNRPFAGLVDNIRVWESTTDDSGALSAEEVAAVWRNDIAVGLPIVPRLVDLGHDGQAFNFSFDTEAGVEYLIERSTDLTQWEPVETVTGDGQSHSVTDPVQAGTDRQFYRVVVQTP